MKRILTSLFLFAAVAVLGQSNFDYQTDFKKILKQTKSQNSNLFYEKLLIRFEADDSTLLDSEVLALMIGFTDKVAYKPYDDLVIERDIYSLNDAAEYQKSLDLANTFLATHPLSQQALIEKGYSCYKLGKMAESNSAMYKFRRIMKAMFYSGLGKDPNQPMFALGPADGQNYILKNESASIGTMGSGTDKNGNFLDILEAKYKNGTSQTFYFIVQHATDKMFIKD